MEKRINNIEHPGIIEKLEPKIAHVRITQQSACASCHSKSYCGMGDNTDKVVEVSIQDQTNYNIGDEVTITLEQNLGYRALLMGYLIPFMILLAALIIVLQITNNEAIAALTALFLMLPYYFLLYKYRSKIRKTFTFKLKK
jgi:sigma-E factor negative regulatory protein RseC